MDASILKRSQEANLLQVKLHNIRDWAADKHKVTDDTPFGGGGGMVLKPEPIFSAVEAILGSPPECPIIFLTPQGRQFNQKVAMELLGYDHLALICGRYEGVDERVREHLATDEISIGDYVLTGGELPALVLIDAVTRLMPGVLGDPDGAKKDSHVGGLLEHPHYTRPAKFRDWEVPSVLRSGDHAKINEWRREQAFRRTAERRPDMLSGADLSEDEMKYLKELNQD